jgi:G3E family GTPase
MAAHSETRVRLTIIGGYLGSGKTTWLRHQLHVGRFKDAFVIVNEAAETPVDDALLGQSSRLAVLAGGCVCCTAKADLIALLRSLCDERSRTASSGDRLEHIVLETSGLADPGPIVEAIRSDPVLVYHIMVGEIIVAVDALHALAQLRSEPLGRRQIEIADQLVVTKVDVAEPESLTRLLATLHHINPGAGLSGAASGTPVPLPDFAVAAPEELPDLSGKDSSQIFPTRLQLGGDVDWTAFTVWLSALLHARGDDVVRVKGVVRTPAGRLLLQTVRKVVQSPEILPEQAEEHGREDDTIVVIGRGYTAEELKCSLRNFARSGRG